MHGDAPKCSPPWASAAQEAPPRPFSTLQAFGLELRPREALGALRPGRCARMLPWLLALLGLGARGQLVLPEALPPPAEGDEPPRVVPKARVRARGGTAPGDVPKPHLGLSSAKLGPRSAKVGPRPTAVGPVSAKLGRLRPVLGRSRPSFLQRLQSWPTLTACGRTRPALGPESTKSAAASTKCRGLRPDLGLSSARPDSTSGPSFAGFGPKERGLGRESGPRPSLGPRDSAPSHQLVLLAPIRALCEAESLARLLELRARSPPLWST